MRTWFQPVQLVKYSAQTDASFALPTVCAANALFFGMWTARVSKNSPSSSTAEQPSGTAHRAWGSLA